jgi:hypothetical protein
MQRILRVDVQFSIIEDASVINSILIVLIKLVVAFLKIHLGRGWFEFVSLSSLVNLPGLKR